MILVSVGRAVRLKNTGELGVINGVLDSETVSVYLNESGMSIAVAIEDLEKPGQSQEKPGTGAFLEEHIPTETNVAIQFSDAGEGINLVFHPRVSDEGRSMDLHLMNTEAFDCSFTIAYFKKSRIIYKKHGVLKALSSIFIETFERDNLSLNPSFEYELRRIIGDGTGESRTGTLKPKPKTFFKNQKKTLSFPQDIFVFKLSDVLPEKHVQSNKKEKLPVKQSEKKVVRQTSRVASPMEIASFSREIDIHIESLRNDHAQMDSYEIFNHQIQQVEQYISKAIRLGVDKVYIIHGKGSGRLKKAVHRILDDNPHVRSYNAGYLQKYGAGGATEVIF